MRGATPLARVLGLGSAKSGAHHWWIERVSGLALIPLGLWLVIAALRVPAWDHAGVVAFVGTGVNPVLLLLTLVSATWHSRLGMQVILEDYVHEPFWKTTALLLNAAVHAVILVAGALAVLKIALAAP